VAWWLDPAPRGVAPPPSFLLSLWRRSSEEVPYNGGSSGLEPSGCRSSLLSFHGSIGKQQRGTTRSSGDGSSLMGLDACPRVFPFFIFYLIY